MSFLGGGSKDPFEPGKTERENLEKGRGGPVGDEPNPNKPTTTRIAIWIIVGAVGVYFIVSGIIGIATHS
ncbi:MAG: hypothetical protein EPO52_06705 [Herbiconiux sp.]|uniref:hypothetical protein n=1 Tax=Herbiconiux sp. TaxID=1871186 RepID=UPI001204E574|nr:hypothetical protein [Herbiconiux sp.]TAJ47883.1 MAG: hypothetical protein EPO52_06705 [Herbiconiux sp.]